MEIKKGLPGDADERRLEFLDMMANMEKESIEFRRRSEDKSRLMESIEADERMLAQDLDNYMNGE